MSIVQTGPDQTLGPQAAALWYAAHGWRLLPYGAEQPPVPRPAVPPLQSAADRTRAPRHQHRPRADPRMVAPVAGRGTWPWQPEHQARTCSTLTSTAGNAGNGFAAFNRLKRAGMLAGATALVRTTSGGLHVYFTGTAQGCGKLPGITSISRRPAGGCVRAAVPGARPPVRAARPPARAPGVSTGPAVQPHPAPVPPGAGQAPGRAGQHWPPSRMGRAATREANTTAITLCSGRRPGPLRLATSPPWTRIAAAGVAAGLSDAQAHKAVSSAVRTVTR